jgi:hypothetical protein
MGFKKLIRLSPFIILVIILIITWYKFLTHQNVPVAEHYWALGLICVNIALYFIRFVYGIILTGVILCLGLFGLIVFSPLKSVTYYGVTVSGTEIRTPYIAPTILILLLIYIAVNANAFMHFYLSLKEMNKRSKN